MSQMAGINWRQGEYFQMAHGELLSDFHQGQLRVYTIAVAELMTAVAITVFRADIWPVKQIILLGTDNQNTFSWIDPRPAKRGLASRIIATFHVWRIKNGIEAYPFYLRSLHNVRPDFITREDERNIALWAAEEGFNRAGKQWWWKQFLACAPKLDRIDGRIVNLPRMLKIWTMDGLGRVGEWGPKSGTALQIFDNLCLGYHAIDGYDLFDYYKLPYCTIWKLVLGSERRKGEIGEFRSFLDQMDVEIAVTVTPDEVGEEIWYPPVFWTQSWRCDSARYGDVLAGSWNVYVKGASMYTSLELDAPGRTIGPIRRAFPDNGLFSWAIQLG